MRTSLAIFFLLTTCICCSQDKTTKLAIARIQYVYQLKKEIGNKAWPSFGEEKYNIPIIYYAGDTTYIANPHEKFQKQFNPRLIFTSGDIKIFQLNHRIDTARLRMLVSVTFGPDTAAYDYYTPYMKCNSREEFIKVTNFRPDTQGWAAMILHEFFHGFQFQYDGYLRYASQANLTNRAIGEALQNLYATQQWYKDYVNTENQLLMKAYKANRKKETDSLIDEFFKIRNERRSHISSSPDFKFDLNEKNFETLEGCARFIEYYVFTIPVGDKHLTSIDENFTINPSHLPGSIDALGNVTEGDYYYATGFNIARLLTKLNIDFKPMLFKQPDISLEDILLKYNRNPS